VNDFNCSCNPDENQLVIAVTSLISSATRQGFILAGLFFLIRVGIFLHQQQQGGKVEMVNNPDCETGRDVLFKQFFSFMICSDMI
jgi:hypothetical protein